MCQASDSSGRGQRRPGGDLVWDGCLSVCDLVDTRLFLFGNTCRLAPEFLYFSSPIPILISSHAIGSWRWHGTISLMPRKNADTVALYAGVMNALQCKVCS